MEQEKVQEFSLVVGPPGPAGASAESVTWKLTNDAGTVLVIGAGSATLSAGTSYTTVDDFSQDFRRLLVALANAGIPRCDRLGVRYLSLARDLPGEERSWRRWFKQDLLGWAGSEVVADGALQTSMSQVTLRLPPTADLSGPPADIEALVRHGAVPPQTVVPGVPPIQVTEPSYLLDLDVYVAGHQAFVPDALVEQFSLFHAQIDRFFYWSLTPEGARHFGL